MNGSTENEREQFAAVPPKANEIGAGLDPNNGYIVVTMGGRPVFGLPPVGAAALASMITGLLAQHPALQVEAPSPILIAGVMPPALQRRLNGR